MEGLDRYWITRDQLNKDECMRGYRLILWCDDVWVENSAHMPIGYCAIDYCFPRPPPKWNDSTKQSPRKKYKRNSVTFDVGRYDV